MKNILLAAVVAAGLFAKPAQAGYPLAVGVAMCSYLCPLSYAAIMKTCEFLDKYGPADNFDSHAIFVGVY